MIKGHASYIYQLIVSVNLEIPIQGCSFDWSIMHGNPPPPHRIGALQRFILSMPATTFPVALHPFGFGHSVIIAWPASDIHSLIAYNPSAETTDGELLQGTHSRDV